MACGILVLLIAAIAASTNGYGSKDYYSGDKEDYSYKPKVVKSSSYSSSSYVSHGHHAGYAGHKLITGHAYKFKVGRIFKRFHNLGVKLIGRGIRYNGFYYGRLCSATKLYGALNSCYEDYGDIGDCFPGLIKQGLIGRRHVYHKYGHGFGLGVTFVRRGIVYGRSYYKYGCRRSKFIRYMTSCYNKFHHASTCVSVLRKRHLIRSPHSYHGHMHLSGYTRFRRFKISHGRFRYGGKYYKLSCSKRRFYSYWNRCYGRYHSVGRCFGYLRRKHLFSYYNAGYSSGGYGAGYRSGHGGIVYDYGYYKSHHGFSIHHNRFTYGGIAYRLKCSRSRFYRHWGQCYHRYHSVGTCFDRLRSLHLFYRYVGATHAILNKHLYHHRRIANNHARRIHNVAKSHVARISHVSNKHIHNIQHQANKHVSRIASVARSHMNRFKQLVDYHLRRLHKHTKYHLSSVEHQHKKHLNERQYQNNKHELNVRHLHKKHEYYLKKHGYRYGHGHSLIHHRFSHGGKGHAYRFHVGRIFNRFHRLGVELIGRGIRYNGFYYGRLCSSTKLYGALNSCYEDYGDIGDCFPGLIKQGLIGRRHVYHKYGHGFGLGVTFVKRGIVYGRSYYKFGCRRSKFIRYMTSCYNKFHHASTCVSVLRKRHLIGSPHSYHGHMHLAGYTRFRRFKISHGRFRYGGKYYKLSCSKRRFYSYWNRCYGRYHSVGRCFGYLRRKHLFSYYNGYSSVTHSAYGAGYSGGITYDFGYYKSHHGFTIRNNQFTYGGIGYKLKCGRSRFYRLWGQCYHRYHSVGSCFGRLHRQHLFYRYGGEDYSEIGYSSGPIYDRSYYYSHHGFRIRHHRFSYNGIAYKLKCSRSRFYRHWGQCYHRYHSVGTCFRRLGRHHLFYRYVRHHHALRKHLYRHKQIAHHHTRRIHKVAKSHVARISHVSNKHVRHIQHQANKHVSRIANEARSHINRFKQLVDYHVKRLHKHTKLHLSTVEHQHKRHLNTRRYQNKKHELNVRHLHKKHEYNLKKHSYAYRHRHSHRHIRYIDYYKKYHGFKIRQHRFSYGGKAYQLACGDKRFWRYWSHCYSHYHSRSVCFGKLKKRRLFDLYTDGYDEEDGYEPAVKEKVY